MAFGTMEVETSSNINTSNEKIEKILQKFLEPDFRIKNDVYLNQFLTRLTGKNDDGDTSRIQSNEQLRKQFCQWIIRASNSWKTGESSPPAAILSFALNLTSQLSCDELTFVTLNCQNVFESLVGVAQANSTEHPNVNLGMVTLLCSFLEHKSGVQWIMATTHWTDVINLGLKADTVYIGQKAHQFVIKLLEKTIEFNQNFAVNLVVILIRPLKDVFQSLPSDKDHSRTQIQDAELYETLQPTLDFLSEVLTTLLKNFDSNILKLFLEQGTQEAAERILLLSQSEDFSFKLLKISFVFLFYKLCAKLNRVKAVPYDSPLLSDMMTMFELIKNEMDKNKVRCVTKLCDYTHDLYCSLAFRMPSFVRRGEVVEFQNQMVFFQLMPILVFSIQILRDPKQPDKLYFDDTVRNEFINKLLRKAAIRTLEICYRWRETLKTKPDLMDDVTFSLQYLAKTKRLLNKERAATMFPALVYVLRDTVVATKILTNIDWTPRCIKFINTLLETIVDFVESFDLTWKDTIETIRVLKLTCEFLRCPEFPDKTIPIAGLKLLKTAISKYMSPDMVLLIYSTKDSTVSRTGSILYTKCQDSSWEIRDSALEVVLTLSRNANSRFPALTNVLLDAELPQLVVNMALKDGEAYVRATAFKCLQEMIQISEICGELLSDDSFLNNLLNVFASETEGIVRKEAAVLINRIYSCQKLPDEIFPRLYDVMTHAVIGDLHWEVRYNALEFWRESFIQHLTDQGMIDYTFPTHTFSKEHKRIVVLTELEVRKRIIKLLNQLSRAGCLHVMKCAVQDECVDVSERAVSLFRKLRCMFGKYKIPCENIDLGEPSNRPVLQRDRQHPQPFESASLSSRSSSTASASPADNGNLGSPQSSDSSFFDTFSPLPAIFSPSLDLGLMSPPSGSEEPVRQQEVPNQTTLNSGTQQDNAATNQITSYSTPMGNLFDVDMSGSGEETFGTTELENVLSNGIDSVTRDQILDEFLNSHDAALLEEIYVPSDQVTNNIAKMNTREYLAPSEFVRFIYNETEILTKKIQQPTSPDEFDSLLDDILKEYDVATDVNSIDCY